MQSQTVGKNIKSRSPLAPLKKGEDVFKVPLLKGDLGGSLLAR